MNSSYGVIHPFIHGSSIYFTIPGTNVSVMGTVKNTGNEYLTIALTECGEVLCDVVGRWFVSSHRIANVKTAVQITGWIEPQRFMRELAYNSCLDIYHAGIDCGNGFRLVDKEDGKFYYWFMDQSGLYVQCEPYDREVCLQVIRKDKASVTVAHKGVASMFKKRLHIVREPKEC